MAMHMIPSIRAGLAEIRGLKVYPSLAAVDRPVDMVEVFRKPGGFPNRARGGGRRRQGVVKQIGVFNEEAARIAEDAGMKVVMDRCPKIELFRASGNQITSGNLVTMPTYHKGANAHGRGARRPAHHFG